MEMKDKIEFKITSDTKQMTDKLEKLNQQLLRVKKTIEELSQLDIKINITEVKIKKWYQFWK